MAVVGKHTASWNSPVFVRLVLGKEVPPLYEMCPTLLLPNNLPSDTP